MLCSASRERWLPLALGFFLSAAQVMCALAQTRTWNINGAGNWNNNANWTPYLSSYSGSSFPNAIDANAVLGSIITGNSAITLGQNITVGNLTISDDNNYTINSGNTLTFDVSSGSAGLTIESTGSPTIASAITLNDPFKLSQGGSGTLTISGAIGGSSSFTKSGSGTANLSAANTLSGAVTVRGGTLGLTGASGALASASGFTINSGGKLLLDNSGTSNTDRIGSVGVTLGGGTFDFTINTASGSYSETAGALSITSGANSVLTDQAASGQTSTLTFSSLSRTANSGATVDFNGTGLGSSTRNYVVFSTPPTLSNGIIGGWATYNEVDWASYTNRVLVYNGYGTGAQTGWTSTMNAKPASSQSLSANRSLYTLNLGSGINVNLGTRVLNLYGGGLLKQGGTASTIYSSTGYLTAGGTGAGELIVQVASGTLLNLGTTIKNNPSSGVVSLVKAGGGTLNMGTNLASTYTGTTLLNAGTLVMNGRQNLSANSLTIDGSSTLQATWTDASLYASPTSITINNGTIERTVASATPTRFLTGGSATLTVNGAATLKDSGNTASGYLGVDGPIVINDGGTLTLNANGANSTVSLGGSQAITINAGGTLATTGTGTAKISDGSARAITATGTTASEATLSLGATSTTYNSSSTLTVNGSGTGGLRVSGAQTAVDGFLTTSRINGLSGSGGTLTVAYTDASGNFDWTKAPTSASSVKLGFDASSTAVVYDLGTNPDDMGNWAGLVIKGGKITLEANQTTMGSLDLKGGLLQLAGTTSVGGKTLALSGDANLSGGQLDEGAGGGGTGLLKVAGNLVSDGTVMVNGPRITMNPSAGTTTVSGSFPLYQVGYFTKDSAGTVRLDQELGATTLEVHAGTLLLGAADRIVNTTSVILSGGTFATGGYNETVGILSLQAGSIIDLGSGASVLHFANSTAASWGGGALGIYNWSGSTNGGGTDQLFFGANESGLTSTQLGMIYFQDPYGPSSGLYDAEYIPGGSGELRPKRLIPEPATVGWALMLLGAIAYRARHRLWSLAGGR
jgi:autotransporter-associated beta strand protein